MMQYDLLFTGDKEGVGQESEIRGSPRERMKFISEIFHRFVRYHRPSMCVPPAFICCNEAPNVIGFGGS